MHCICSSNGGKTMNGLEKLLISEKIDYQKMFIDEMIVITKKESLEKILFI